jgi:hypothetical protein
MTNVPAAGLVSGPLGKSAGGKIFSHLGTKSLGVIARRYCDVLLVVTCHGIRQIRPETLITRPIASSALILLLPTTTCVGLGL